MWRRLLLLLVVAAADVVAAAAADAVAVDNMIDDATGVPSVDS